MSLTFQQIKPDDPEVVAALAVEHLPTDDLVEDGRLFSGSRKTAFCSASAA
jgi:hypothetical protein